MAQIEFEIVFMDGRITSIVADSVWTGFQLYRELDKTLPPGKTVQTLLDGDREILESEILNCPAESVAMPRKFSAVMGVLEDKHLLWKGYGYAAIDLQNRGYSTERLLNAYYTVWQLHAAGCSVDELRKAGCSAWDICRELSCSVLELREAGFEESEVVVAAKAKELRKAGYSPQRLFELRVDRDERAYTFGEVMEFYESRYDIAAVEEYWLQSMSPVTSLASMVDAGYTFQELREAGCGEAEFIKAGGRVEALRIAGYSVQQLRQCLGPSIMVDAGYTFQELREAGCGEAEFIKAGGRVEALRLAGYSVQQLRQCLGPSIIDKGPAGLDIIVRGAGYSLKELREGGYGAKTLCAAGYGVWALLGAGYYGKDARLLQCEWE